MGTEILRLSDAKGNKIMATKNIKPIITAGGIIEEENIGEVIVIPTNLIKISRKIGKISLK
jgi:hypothetical protein